MSSIEGLPAERNLRYSDDMLNHRTKRLAARGAVAAKRLAMIDASIAALGDEDLLDLADIFKNASDSPMTEMTRAELAKRSIEL